MAQYAEITEIEAPAQAVAGSQVNITARIRNLYPAEISIMVGGALEYGVSPWPGITYPANWVNTPTGWVAQFSGYFIMPSANVKIHAYSYWYGADGYWYFDDEKTRIVNLAVLSPVFSDFLITNYWKY
jgi:hypothetical protein